MAKIDQGRMVNYKVYCGCSLSPGVGAIYCHATSKDAAKADPEGVIRAERLAKAAASAGVEHIVYNSSGMYQLKLLLSMSLE